MAECAALVEWAETLPERVIEPRASDELIERQMDFLNASLPSRKVGEDAGRKRWAVYTSVLREFSRPALEHACASAVRTLDWFPTPHQLIDLAREYVPPLTEKNATLRLCQRFADEAFDAWATNVRAGQPIGDVPEQWMRIGEAQGWLRRLDDGAFVSRALYAGPRLPIARGAE